METMCKGPMCQWAPGGQVTGEIIYIDDKKNPKLQSALLGNYTIEAMTKAIKNGLKEDGTVESWLVFMGEMLIKKFRFREIRVG